MENLYLGQYIFLLGKPLLLEVKISKLLVKKMAIKETCKHVFQKKIVELQLVRSIKLLKNKDLLDILKRSSKKELFPAGSSLKICLVASGDCHIYPRFGDVGQWDIAAGHAILKASGGNIVDLDMNEIEYNFDKTFKINGFYALSTKHFLVILFNKINKLSKIISFYMQITHF